ncbi:ATP-binding protein [Kutzneria sp. NPDC051319]|uniref:sensor histidine kinase n=1 Tax=Kutzneria sp. NPDC051319 TaxID=3155047 RepID=UPI0034388925
MSLAGYPARVPSFLVQLLRRGAPVIAATPRDVPDQVVDPTPVPGWQRISAMCSAESQPEPDSLMARACKYVVLVPMVYRFVVLPAMLFPVLASGHTGLGLAVGLVLFVLNAATIVWALRVPSVLNESMRGLLITDSAIAVTANLVVGYLDPSASALTWTHLVGSVALWTVAWGIPFGLLLAALSVPMQAAMSLPVITVVGNTLLLGVTIVTSTGALLLVGLGTRLALGLGIRRGREAEAAKVRRELHDTVLQALEVMALPVAGDDHRTVELRGIARAQAMELRRGLAGEPDLPHPTTIGEDLTLLATEMAREGLRAQLVFSEVDDSTMPEARRRAVRDAAREALRNTMKHSGTNVAVLRIEERDGGIAVIARDHGSGFSDADRPAGFGISESIAARLAEVGGRSQVHSQPGRGTRVTLWVPR